MAKWSGKIGYIIPEEIRPGTWVDGKPAEHIHYGDTISARNQIRQMPDSTNSDIILAMNVSIIADSFANENLGYMKYVIVRGVKWKITSVDTTQRPRLILTIGGVYNGKKTQSS